MRVPIRKAGQYTNLKPDPYLTEKKFNELKDQLERLKKISRPRASEEVRRLAEMGDFSENAAYQIAKGRLRGINQKILELEDHLRRVIIIRPSNSASEVRIGNQVTIEDMSGKQKQYLILGSSEANPTHGTISHNSPLGLALIGKKINDTVKIKTPGKEVEYKIIDIQ